MKLTFGKEVFVMDSKSLSLRLESGSSWEKGGSEEALGKIENEIKKDYKNDELKPLSKGTFAKVYSAIRIKNDKEKPVAVRIVVTNKPKTFKQEKRPGEFFKKLKEEVRGIKIEEPTLGKLALTSEGKNAGQKPYYYDYINVPKLRYEVDFDSQLSDRAWGLVFESELADRDAWPKKADSANKSSPLQYIPKLITDVAKALKLLHSKGKIHSDLKPNNILVKGNKPENISFQLTDFGMNWKIKEFENEKLDLKKIKETITTKEAFEKLLREKFKFYNNKLAKRFVQNKFYQAPEKQDAFEIWDYVSDNMSIGMYAFESDDDVEQFVENNNALIEAIEKIGPASDVYSLGKTVCQIASEVSPQELKSNTMLQNLVKKMLATDPENRPDLDEILNDVYVKGSKPPVDTTGVEPIRNALSK